MVDGASAAKHVEVELIREEEDAIHPNMEANLTRDLRRKPSHVEPIPVQVRTTNKSNKNYFNIYMIFLKKI